MANADRIVDLLHEAKALPAGAERERFLAEACGDDTVLKEQIVSLLEADAGEGDSAFLKNPPLIRQKTIVMTEKPGDKIGRYKLLQQIGEGGCGIVYMAEQEEPVRRRVALKVIKLGMDTKQVIARFEAERQALALMDHPNIAKVLDAGATDLGRPFFVMELVRGIKITDFCDKNVLSTEERLKLFMQVCQAIQHAHQKGIIHRDIKPSNILVTSQDGVPVPKVIDFGIAKATTDQRLTDKTVFTAFEQFIGTPAYMSPEQAEMSALDIDTRSDIYSLGVLLYELLTGGPPFDQKELLAAGLDAMRRTIREEEPPRPSNRLSTLAADTLATTALHRHTEPPKLLHLVRGDLDWIAMKCLEKDRARRYEMANALAADIRRHLDNEPVVARPPSHWYEFQKTVRRHKLGFAAAAGLILVLAVGAMVSTWQAVRATKAEKLANDRLAQVAAERDAKEQALQEAEAISGFLGEIIQSPDPTRTGHTIQVVELLGKAAKRLETGLAGQPEQKAKLQTRLGLTYASLGLNREAIPLQEKARDYYLASVGREHTNTLNAMHNLANSYDEVGRHGEALQIREEVLDLRRKALGPEHPDTLKAMGSVAVSYSSTGRYDEELKLSEEVLKLRRKVLGPEHPDTVASMNNLANSCDTVGRRLEALKIREEVLELYRKALGPEHPDTLNAMGNLAISYYSARRYDEALKLGEEVLVLSRKVLGLEHPRTLNAMRGTATYLEVTGHNDEALKLREEVLEFDRKKLGTEDRSTLNDLNYLAISYRVARRLPAATSLQEQTLASIRRVLLPNDPVLTAAMENLASIYLKTGRRDEALKLREEVLSICRDTRDLDHPDTVWAMINVAELYRGRDFDRVDEAIRLGESALEISRRGFGPTHPDTLNAMTELAISYRVAGRTDEAIALEEEALRLKRQHLPPGHSHIIDSLENLAQCYEKADRKAEAEGLRREATELKAKAKAGPRQGTGEKTSDPKVLEPPAPEK